MNYQLIAPRVPSMSMVEQVLTNRGINLTDVKHYLHTSDADILDPSTIARIQDGAKMLIKHISQNDKVFIQIDSDCDGYTSAATLINYLNRLFPGFVQNNISYRLHEGKAHGLILDTIPTDVKLVIAPDSSSNDYEVHEQLAQRGVDVLVIDHHEADHVSEYACVINNQLCDYPTKSLSGVGMVYKFCSYIDSLLNVDYADDYLDLVALGLIADMMDLRDFETRHLITLGISQIRNPYFKGMVVKNSFSLGDTITPFGIAFYVAPYINAVTRCGTQDEKLILFESMLDHRAYEMINSTKRGCKGQKETRVEQACRNCTNIKNRQGKSRDASLETIERLIKTRELLNNKIIIVTLDKAHMIDRNLTGLAATKIANEYQRPTLILNESRQEDGTILWEGSGRNCNQSSFENFREFLDESGYFEYAEGHEGAFGVGIADDDIPHFIAYSNIVLQNFDFTPKYYIDFEYDINTLTSADILNIADLDGLWGQCIEEPYVLIKNVKLTAGNLSLLKGTTIKINLKDDINLIKFKSSESEYNNLYTDMGCVTVNIVGRFQKNSWNGRVNPQILIEDYEIVDKSLYYF